MAFTIDPKTLDSLDAITKDTKADNIYTKDTKAIYIVNCSTFYFDILLFVFLDNLHTRHSNVITD